MNNDMANTHGDLLVKSVHKHSSLDHLMRGVELGNWVFLFAGGSRAATPLSANPRANPWRWPRLRLHSAYSGKARDQKSVGGRPLAPPPAHF